MSRRPVSDIDTLTDLLTYVDRLLVHRELEEGNRDIIREYKRDLKLPKVGRIRFAKTVIVPTEHMLAVQYEWLASKRK